MRTVDGHHVLQALGKISAPILVLDALGLVAWVNDAALELASASDEPIVGLSFVRLVDPDSRSTLRDAIARIVLGQAESADVVVRSANGRNGDASDVAISLSPVLLDGYVAGIVAVSLTPLRPRKRLGVFS